MLVLSTNLESNWLNLEYKGRELCMCVKEFKEVKASESCLSWVVRGQPGKR